MSNRLFRVSLNGLKGQDITLKSTGCDVLCGPIGCGKTAVLQGVALGILGYVPGVERKPRAMLDALSPTGQIDVRLDATIGSHDRVSVARRVAVDDRGSGSLTTSVHPPAGAKGKSAVEEHVAVLLGQNQTMLLDMAEYVGLSDAKRHERIKDMLPLGPMSVGEFRERIQKGMAADVARDLLCSLGDLPCQMSIAACLDRLIETSRNYTSEYRKKKDALSKAVTEFGGVTLAGLDSRIAKATERRREATASILELNRQLAASASANEANQAHEAVIASVGREIDGLVKQHADLVRELNRLTADLAIFECDAKKYIEQVASAVGCERPGFQLEAQSENLSRFCSELADQEDALTERLSSVNGVIAFLRSTSRNGEAATCPLSPECDRPVDDIISTRAAEADALQTERDKVAATRKAAVKARECVSLLEQQRPRCDEYRATIEAVTRDIEQKRAELEDARDKAQAARETSVSSGMPVEQLNALLTQAETTLSAAESELSRLQEQRARAIAVENTRIELEAVSAKYDAWASAVEALGPKGLLGALVRESLDSFTHQFVEIASAITDLTPSIETDHPDGSDKLAFRVGATKPNGVFVKLENLSSGEQALIWLAFSAALMASSDTPLRVMLCDNLERLDDAALERLLTGVVTLVENGTIHNFIGACCRPVPVVPGVGVVSIEGK